MASATRLPGIAFDVAPPSPPEALPRMDIAGFVGFTAAGPVDVPVAVEDPAQFTAVFGADAPIAWDPVHGEPAYALLGPAVRAFFRNGGRRCWVVRVADLGHARRDAFELAGVVAVDEHGAPGFAALRARAVGSWADGLTVSTALESAPLAFPGAALGAGDLVRLRFDDALLYATVGADGTLDRRLWVRPAKPSGAIAIRFLGPAGDERGAAAIATAEDPAGSPPGSPPDAMTAWAPGVVRLVFDQPLADAPLPGATVLGDGGLVLSVTAAEATSGGTVALTCGAVQAGAAPSTGTPDGAAERLTLRVLTQGGFGFAPAHPAFLGALPTDEASPSAAGARFPLAGPQAPPPWYVPLFASILGSPALGALHDPAPALERDGLATFSTDLFLDPALRAGRAETLLQTAGFIRDQSAAPRPLTGIHALLDNDEVTLLAVPDAVQPGWIEAAVSPAPAPQPPAPVAPPDWSRFQACATRIPSTPQFDSPPASLHLTWTATDDAEATYELQRASDPAYADAETIYEGAARALELSCPPAGASVYVRVRVRAHVDTAASAWSDGRLLHHPADERWFLDDASTQTPLAAHVAVLRMCAARGDILALLALPDRYKTADALAYVRALKGEPDRVLSFGALYHPWLVCSEPDAPATFRRTPPDGAAAGLAAGRVAWLAPAATPLRDVIELGQALDADALMLAQIAVVREDPAGFEWLAADTLAGDPDVRPINVRRLLALLRRVAERHGNAQVFEPDTNVTRRTIVRTFEALLGSLYAAGAFAGDSAAQAFQVSIPGGGAPGRLIVELRVAPSRPLEFLTVRLIRTGDGSLEVQGS